MKWWIGIFRCLSMSFSGLPAHAMPMWNLRSGTIHCFDIGKRGMSMLGEDFISSSVRPRANRNEANVDHASASPGKFDGEGRKLRLGRCRKACSKTRRNSDCTHMWMYLQHFDACSTKRANESVSPKP